MFPKGHIEKGETPDVAAVREAKEEAGVFVQLDCYKPIGYSAFVYKKEKIVVEWWTGLATAKDPDIMEYDEPSWREIKWAKPDEALQLLTFPHLRNVLRKALCLEGEEKE